jgi:hypothetical protein
MKAFAVLLFLVLFVVGCEEQKEEDFCNGTSIICTCDKTALSPSSCIEYDGFSTDGAIESCIEGLGNFESTACSASGVLGSCTISLLGSTSSTEYYYSDASTGQVACAFVGGQWETP